MGRKIHTKIKKWQQVVRDIYFDNQGNINASQIKNILDSKNIPDAPTHPNSIQKYVAKHRISWNTELEKGLESPWSLGAMGKPEYHIPPEAIRIILEVQKKATYPITIRRARWIAYLSNIIRDDVTALKDISFNYAYAELLANSAGKVFNSSEYDQYLTEKSKRKELIDKFSEINIDVETQNAMLGKLTDGKLSPARKIEIRGGKVYAISQNHYVLSSNILTSMGLWKYLQKEGWISPQLEYKDGEVVLERPLFLDKKQLKNIIKDGESNGKR